MNATDLKTRCHALCDKSCCGARCTRDRHEHDADHICPNDHKWPKRITPEPR